MKNVLAQFTFSFQTLYLGINSSLNSFRLFNPPKAEDEDWYDPMLNPFCDKDNNSETEDDHYETIDDVQAAVAALVKREQEANSSVVTNVPKAEETKKMQDAGYSKVDSGRKVRPPRPKKRPASVSAAAANAQIVPTVETQTSFDKEEKQKDVAGELERSASNALPQVQSKSADIPEDMASENDQSVSSLSQEDKT